MTANSPELDLSPEFLEIAACPACHSKFAVDYDNRELVCASSQCGLAYPVRDNIPILLIDEARNTRASQAEPPVE